MLTSILIVAALTPFNPDLTIDKPLFFNHCKYLVEEKQLPIVLFGTTGEGKSISAGSKIDALDYLVDSGISPDEIILNISDSNIMNSFMLAENAQKKRVNYFLSMPPYHSDNENLDYYSDLFNSLDPAAQLYLYHFPKLGGNVSISLAKELKSRYPNNIVGIKDSSGNMDTTKKFLKLRSNTLQIFVGNELDIPEAKNLGATGGISGTANIAPDMLNAFIKNPDLHRKNLKEFLTFVQNDTPSFVSAFKVIAAHIYRNDTWERVADPELTPLLMPKQKNELLKKYEILMQKGQKE